MNKNLLRQKFIPVIRVTIWVVIAFIIAQVLTFALFWILARFGVPFQSMNQTVVNAVVSLVAYIFAVIITIGAPQKLFKRTVSRADLGFDRLPTWTDIGLGFIAFIPYVLGSYALAQVVIFLYSGFQADQMQNVGFSNISQRYEYFLAFLTLVVLAPVVEELLFRGYLYGRIKKYAPVWISIVITSFVFALLHLQLNVGIDVFVLSIFLCILREVTGSIWAGIILHMSKNALAFYVLFVAPMLLQ